MHPHVESKISLHVKTVPDGGTQEGQLEADYGLQNKCLHTIANQFPATLSEGIHRAQAYDS